jgi:hypothetical protein
VQYGHYTDAPEDNLLGLTTKEALNEQEALGVATVERYLLEEVNYSVEFSVALVQELHRRAFGHLYDWAGQWRRMVPNVDAYVPPPAARVPQRLHEWADKVRQRQLPVEPTAAQVAELLAYAHHRLIAQAIRKKHANVSYNSFFVNQGRRIFFTPSLPAPFKRELRSCSPAPSPCGGYTHLGREALELGDGTLLPSHWMA